MVVDIEELIIKMLCGKAHLSAQALEGRIQEEVRWRIGRREN